MGHGNSLTDHEKGMIDAFEKDGHSQREIAKEINRSKCAVDNYIKNKNKTPKKIPSWPEKISPRNKRANIRDVRKSGKSVPQFQLPGDFFKTACSFLVYLPFILFPERFVRIH